MLVLRRKEKERIIINEGQIVITVTSIDRNTVRLGFECDKSIDIMREELFIKTRRIERKKDVMSPSEGEGGGE